MTPFDFHCFIGDIHAATNGVRFTRASEKAFQSRLEWCFKQRGLRFTRECKLSRQDIPDFLFDNGVALECKVENALEKHLRQCKRYAAHDQVTGVVLVAMPLTLNDKPCACLNFAGKCL